MFDQLKPLPPDAILGIMQLFRADEFPGKVDLSVGVYQDDDGNTPILESVKQAEKIVYDQETTKSYVAPAGNARFNRLMEELVFGADSAVLRQGRVATVQGPGGSGALSVASHLIQRARPGARIFCSDPSWPNHVPLLSLSGARLESYPYYDFAAHRVDFDGMVAAIEKMQRGDYLLLHGCCHNPCGADLSDSQWQVVAGLCARLGLIPFIDLAYLGLARGLEDDAYGVRLMAESVPEMIVVSSCSKNFGLYRERVGTCSVVFADDSEREGVASNLANVARSLYSMPPDHGAAIVATILGDATLRKLWYSEVDAIRNRLNGQRRLLVEKLAARGTRTDFSFIANESGMFSFLGLSREQIVRLREEFHVYMVESSRINVAGVNSRNVDYVVDSIAAVD
ncbi:MAG: amino acid aminotransferase [Gammaproteobacteria bacterium]